MSTFVLIPGGWHGGWYFQPLAEALRARGHHAHPVTLTGLGERRHLLDSTVNLDVHIDDVVQLIETERLSEVVLLGHGYGGMVLSGVIDRVPDRIAAAIYSDAYVPDDGQSCFELTSDLFRQIANPPPSIRRGYIYLSGWQDTPFTSVYQRLCRDPAWKTFSLPVGHNVMKEAFDQLLEIALQFA